MGFNSGFKGLIQIYTCKQFSRDSPTFAGPQTFRFLFVRTLKIISIFSSNWTLKHFFLYRSNRLIPLWDLWSSVTLHIRMCRRVHWLRWGTLRALVETCDLIHNKNSAIIKL